MSLTSRFLRNKKTEEELNSDFNNLSKEGQKAVSPMKNLLDKVSNGYSLGFADIMAARLGVLINQREWEEEVK